MPDEVLPERGARLGRGMGATGVGGTVQGVVLLLPRGEPTGTRRPSRLSAATVRPLARRLVRAGEREGLAAHVVHYRCRGWNGADAHPAGDAEWAVDEVVRRYGDVPVCLAGVGMGARAALRAGGHPAVSAVLALAPWFPAPAPGPESGPDQPPEPVKHLVGRQILLVHGTHDQRSDPELSFLLAERIKKINPDVCRFEVHADGHGLRQYRAEVLALSADFLLGALFARGFSRPVVDALAAPPPLGLRMPLAAGFGATLPG